MTVPLDLYVDFDVAEESREKDLSRLSILFSPTLAKMRAKLQEYNGPGLQLLFKIFNSRNYLSSRPCNGSLEVAVACMPS